VALAIVLLLALVDRANDWTDWLTYRDRDDYPGWTERG
jgi:hypothetical protein